MEKWLYLLRRFGEGVFIVFCIVTVNFFLIRFMPGDPVRHILGEDEYFNLMSMDPDKIEEVRADYGLDKSYPEQYLAYLNKTIHLDFGNSYRTKNTVLSTIVFRAKMDHVAGDSDDSHFGNPGGGQRAVLRKKSGRKSRWLFYNSRTCDQYHSDQLSGNSVSNSFCF